MSSLYATAVGSFGDPYLGPQDLRSEPRIQTSDFDFFADAGQSQLPVFPFGVPRTVIPVNRLEPGARASRFSRNIVPPIPIGGGGGPPGGPPMLVPPGGGGGGGGGGAAAIPIPPGGVDVGVGEAAAELRDEVVDAAMDVVEEERLPEHLLGLPMLVQEQNPFSSIGGHASRLETSMQGLRYDIETARNAPNEWLTPNLRASLERAERVEAEGQRAIARRAAERAIRYRAYDFGNQVSSVHGSPIGSLAEVTPIRTRGLQLDKSMRSSAGRSSASRSTAHEGSSLPSGIGTPAPLVLTPEQTPMQRRPVHVAVTRASDPTRIRHPNQRDLLRDLFGTSENISFH